MHEFSIARKLLGAVLGEAEKRDAKTVRGIVIELGELADVTGEELMDALEIVSRGTIAEKAKIKIETMPIKIKCLKGHEGILKKGRGFGEGLFIQCPECGANATVVSGRECSIKRVKAENA